MMWMMRPGGYNGRCSVKAMELSLGCVVAFRAEVRCWKISIEFSVAVDWHANRPGTTFPKALINTQHGE